MKRDAQGEVHSCQDDGPFELMEEEVDQASLEDEGVEEHEENDDDVEEDCDILDDEEHQLYDWSCSEKLREGIDKEVIGQQQELQGEHQAIVTGLKHLPSALLRSQGHIPQFLRKQLLVLPQALSSSEWQLLPLL